jgi:hypothetical protein
MRVDDIERAHVIFNCLECLHKRAAHVVRFVDEIIIELESTAVIVHAMNQVVMRLIIALPREHVNLMATPLQTSRQFCDMDRHSAHRNRMQGFPSK